MYIIVLLCNEVSMLNNLESNIYEIYEEYDEHAKIFGSYDIARRDTREKEPTRLPNHGVETEQRPPASTDTPTAILSTKTSSNKTEQKMSTSSPGANTTGGTQKINKTVIVSETTK